MVPGGVLYVMGSHGNPVQNRTDVKLYTIRQYGGHDQDG